MSWEDKTHYAAAFPLTISTQLLSNCTTIQHQSINSNKQDYHSSFCYTVGISSFLHVYFLFYVASTINNKSKILLPVDRLHEWNSLFKITVITIYNFSYNGIWTGIIFDKESKGVFSFSTRVSLKNLQVLLCLCHYYSGV